MEEKDVSPQIERVKISGPEDVYDLKEGLYYHLRRSNIAGWSVFPFDGSRQPIRGFLFYPNDAGIFDFPKFEQRGSGLVISIDRLTRSEIKDLAWYERSVDIITHPNDARVTVQRFTFPLHEQTGATLSLVRLNPD